MEEAPKNGKESSHSAHANGIGIAITILKVMLKMVSTSSAAKRSRAAYLLAGLLLHAPVYNMLSL
jgi:hypothetical protein